jgi:hypothetical protein
VSSKMAFGRRPLLFGVGIGVGVAALVIGIIVTLRILPSGGGPTPTPLPTLTPGAKIVALGDSFISGEGAVGSAYLPGTNVVGSNECRRAKTAYPQLVANALNLKIGVLRMLWRSR